MEHLYRRADAKSYKSHLCGWDLQEVRMNGTWLPRECGLGFLRATSRLKSVRMVSGLAWIRTAHQFVDENGVTLRGWIDSEDLTLWEPDARVQFAVGNAKTWNVMECHGDCLCVIVVPSGTCTCSRDQTTSTGTVIVEGINPAPHIHEQFTIQKWLRMATTLRTPLRITTSRLSIMR